MERKEGIKESRNLIFRARKRFHFQMESLNHPTESYIYPVHTWLLFLNAIRAHTIPLFSKLHAPTYPPTVDQGRRTARSPACLYGILKCNQDFAPRCNELLSINPETYVPAWCNATFAFIYKFLYFEIQKFKYAKFWC